MSWRLAEMKTEVSATWGLAWPVVVTQLGVMCMGLVDCAMVGPLGPDALAAVSIGGSLWFTAVSLLLGVVMALDPLISQAWGAGERGEVGAIFWQGNWVAVAAGSVLSLAFLDTSEAFRLLGQTDAVSELAGRYVHARAWSVLPFLFFAVGRSLLNGAGVTRPVMFIAVVANVFNYFADSALIQGRYGAPALGVDGAGLATTATQVAMVLALWAVLKAPRFAEIDLRMQRPNLRRMLGIVRLGLPIGGQLVTEFGVFAAAATIAGQVSALSLAAHQIALGLASFNYMVPLGLSIAASIRVGQAIGARDIAAAERAGRVALLLGGGAMAALGVVFLILPRQLASLFSPDLAVVALAVDLLRIAAAFQIFDGVQCVASGCLRGAGDTRAAFAANVLAHWFLGLPLGWLLAIELDLGVRGVWWGLVFSLGMAAVLLAWRFLRGSWRGIGRAVA